jgi:hypothetical protein
MRADCVFGRQHAAASHRAQRFARFQLSWRLLQGPATGDQKQWRQRDKNCAETHEHEGETMFAKSDHDYVTYFDAS